MQTNLYDCGSQIYDREAGNSPSPNHAGLTSCAAPKEVMAKITYLKSRSMTVVPLQ